MEKLKNLLNEYEGSKKIYVKWNLGEHGKLFQGNFRNSDLRIISKSYGFIQWLVDNNKIDREKNVLAFSFSSVYTYEGYDYENHLKLCKLLMLLSIQDEPIEFLVSILK